MELLRIDLLADVCHLVDALAEVLLVLLVVAGLLLVVCWLKLPLLSLVLKFRFTFFSSAPHALVWVVRVAAGVF